MFFSSANFSLPRTFRPASSICFWYLRAARGDAKASALNAVPFYMLIYHKLSWNQTKIGALAITNHHPNLALHKWQTFKKPPHWGYHPLQCWRIRPLDDSSRQRFLSRKWSKINLGNVQIYFTMIFGPHAWSFYTHTHLFRTVIANSVVECILHAKNTSRNRSAKRPEKASRSYHRYSQCSFQIENVGNISKWSTRRF